MALQKIEINSLLCNPMSKISDEWLLLTAGNENRGFNTMTACWGDI